MNRATPTRAQLAWHVAWLLVGVGLIGLVVVVSGRSASVVDTLRGARPLLVLAALVPAVVAPFAHAWRWQRMLLAVGQPLRLRAAVRATIAATLANYALPGYAWAPLKGMIARQAYGVALVRSVPTLAVEIALDVGALATGAGLAIMCEPGVRRDLQLAPPTPLGNVILGIVCLVVILGLTMRWRRRAVEEWLRSLWSSARRLAGTPSLYPWLAGLTLARWAADFGALWLVTAALELRLDPVALLLVGSVSVLAGILVPVPGGIGVREGGVVVIGTLLGLPPGLMAGAALLHRVVLLAGLPVAFALSPVRFGRQQ